MIVFGFRSESDLFVWVERIQSYEAAIDGLTEGSDCAIALIVKSGASLSVGGCLHERTMFVVVLGQAR